MREIKFKFWSKQIEFMLTWEQWGLEVTVNQAFNDKEYIPLQYTGLKDKNGKEIYEGDIVKQYALDGVDLRVIEFNQEETYFGFKDYPMQDAPLGSWDLQQIEIIGNIYENHELLPENGG